MAIGSPDINLVVGADLSLAERQVQGFINSFSRISGRPLGEISDKATEFTKSMGAANARVIAFGASAGIIYSVGKALTDLVASTISVNKALTEINSLFNATTGNLEKFGNSLFSIAKETGRSFNDIAQGAQELARQGLGAAETLKRLRDAAILSRQSGLGMDEAINGLTATINSFNRSALDSTQIINKLANVDQNFAVSSADLVEALKRVGSTAQEAGVDLDSLLGVVTSVQQTTQRGGAVIGNALKTIFTRIERPAVLNQLEDVGVAVRDAGRNLLPTVTILQNLSKAFFQAGEAGQSQLAELVSNVYQINVLKALLGDISKEYSTFASATEISSRSQNEALQRNEAYNKSLDATINKTRLVVQQAGIRAGNLAVAPVINSIANTVDFVFGGSDKEDKAREAGVSVKKAFVDGVLKGLGEFLSGPGLALVGLAIAKLGGEFAKFTGRAAREFFALNQGTKEQSDLQGRLSEILARQSGLQDAILKGKVSQIQVERELLAIVQKRVEIDSKLSTTTRIAAQNFLQTGEVKYITVNENRVPIINKKASGGLIPNFYDEKTERAEVAGALAGGYQPGKIKQVYVKDIGPVVFNSAETVKDFGFSQPAIMPPAQSRAGRDYKQKFVGVHGFDPYTTNVPSFRFADGMVPFRYPVGKDKNQYTGMGSYVLLDDSIDANQTQIPSDYFTDLEKYRIKYPSLRRRNKSGGLVPSFANYKFRNLGRRGVANIDAAYSNTENPSYYGRAYEDYHNLTNIFSGQLGVSSEDFATVFSKLSPRNPLERNFLDTISTVGAFKAGARPSSISVQTFDNNKQQAFDFLKGKTGLTGPKRIAFADNILNPFASQLSTVDYRAAGTYAGRIYTPYEAPKLTEKDNAIVQSAFSKVADLHDILPLNIQAATWYDQRRRLGFDTQGSNRGLISHVLENGLPSFKEFEKLKKNAVSIFPRRGQDEFFTIPKASGLVPNYAYIPLLTPLVGKIATNVTHSGSGFGMEALQSSFQYLASAGVRKTLKNLMADKRIYDEDQFLGNDSDEGISEFAFRKMFGLESRATSPTPIKEIGKRTYSLTGKAKSNLGYSIYNSTTRFSDKGNKIFAVSNNVPFGNFITSYEKNTGLVRYKDTWDFELHPHEKLSLKGAAKELKNRVLSNYPELDIKLNDLKGILYSPSLKFAANTIGDIGKTVFNRDFLRNPLDPSREVKNAIIPDNSYTSYSDTHITRFLRAAVSKISAPVTFQGVLKPGDENYELAAGAFTKYLQRKKQGLNFSGGLVPNYAGITGVRLGVNGTYGHFFDLQRRSKGIEFGRKLFHNLTEDAPLIEHEYEMSKILEGLDTHPLLHFPKTFGSLKKSVQHGGIVKEVVRGITGGDYIDQFQDDEYTGAFRLVHSAKDFAYRELANKGIRTNDLHPHNFILNNDFRSLADELVANQKGRDKINLARQYVPKRKELFDEFAQKGARVSLIDPGDFKLKSGGLVPNYAISLGAMKSIIREFRSADSANTIFRDSNYPPEARTLGNNRGDINIPKGLSSEAIVHEVGHVLGRRKIDTNEGTYPIEHEQDANSAARLLLADFGTSSDFKNYGSYANEQIKNYKMGFLVGEFQKIFRRKAPAIQESFDSKYRSINPTAPLGIRNKALAEVLRDSIAQIGVDNAKVIVQMQKDDPYTFQRTLGIKASRFAEGFVPPSPFIPGKVKIRGTELGTGASATFYEYDKNFRDARLGKKLFHEFLPFTDDLVEQEYKFAKYITELPLHPLITAPKVLGSLERSQKARRVGKEVFPGITGLSFEVNNEGPPAEFSRMARRFAFQELDRHGINAGIDFHSQNVLVNDTFAKSAQNLTTDDIATLREKPEQLKSYLDGIASLGARLGLVDAGFFKLVNGKRLPYSKGLVPNYALSFGTLKEAIKTFRAANPTNTIFRDNKYGPYATFEGLGRGDINIPKRTSGEIILHEIGHALSEKNFSATRIEVEQDANTMARQLIAKNGNLADFKSYGSFANEQIKNYKISHLISSLSFKGLGRNRSEQFLKEFTDSRRDDVNNFSGIKEDNQISSSYLRKLIKEIGPEKVTDYIKSIKRDDSFYKRNLGAQATRFSDGLVPNYVNEYALGYGKFRPNILGLKDIFKDPKGTLSPHKFGANHGLVPNFSALGDAIKRERGHGVLPNLIRIGTSKNLQSGANPFGLGVYNTHDEPFGLNQGIQRAVKEGTDPRNYGAAKGLVPNFAQPYEFTSGPGFAFNKLVSEEVEKLKQAIRQGTLKTQEFGAEIEKLTKVFPLAHQSVLNIANTLKATYETRPGNLLTALQRGQQRANDSFAPYPKFTVIPNFPSQPAEAQQLTFSQPKGLLGAGSNLFNLPGPIPRPRPGPRATGFPIKSSGTIYLPSSSAGLATELQVLVQSLSSQNEFGVGDILNEGQRRVDEEQARKDDTIRRTGIIDEASGILNLRRQKITKQDKQNEEGRLSPESYTTYENIGPYGNAALSTATPLFFPPNRPPTRGPGGIDFLLGPTRGPNDAETARYVATQFELRKRQLQQQEEEKNLLKAAVAKEKELSELRNKLNQELFRRGNQVFSNQPKIDISQPASFRFGNAANQQVFPQFYSGGAFTRGTTVIDAENERRNKAAELRNAEIARLAESSGSLKSFIPGFQERRDFLNLRTKYGTEGISASNKSRAILVENNQNRAFAASFGAPVVAGILSEGVGQLGPEGVGLLGGKATRGAQAVTTGLGNIVSSAALGFSIGGRFGVQGGAIGAIVAGIPAVIESIEGFTSKLPDLAKRLEELAETSERSSNALKSYSEAGAQLEQIRGGVSKARPEDIQRLQDQQEIALSVLSPERRNRLQTVINNGGGQADVQRLIAKSQEEDRTVVNFTQFENFIAGLDKRKNPLVDDRSRPRPTVDVGIGHGFASFGVSTVTPFQSFDTKFADSIQKEAAQLSANLFIQRNEQGKNFKNVLFENPELQSQLESARTKFAKNGDVTDLNKVLQAGFEKLHIPKDDIERITSSVSSAGRFQPETAKTLFGELDPNKLKSTFEILKRAEENSRKEAKAVDDFALKLSDTVRGLIIFNKALEGSSRLRLQSLTASSERQTAIGENFINLQESVSGPETIARLKREAALQNIQSQRRIGLEEAQLGFRTQAGSSISQVGQAFLLQELALAKESKTGGETIGGPTEFSKAAFGFLQKLQSTPEQLQSILEKGNFEDVKSGLQDLADGLQKESIRLNAISDTHENNRKADVTRKDLEELSGALTDLIYNVEGVNQKFVENKKALDINSRGVTNLIEQQRRINLGGGLSNVINSGAQIALQAGNALGVRELARQSGSVGVAGKASLEFANILQSLQVKAEDFPPELVEDIKKGFKLRLSRILGSSSGTTITGESVDKLADRQFEATFKPENKEEKLVEEIKSLTRTISADKSLSELLSLAQGNRGGVVVQVATVKSTGNNNVTTQTTNSTAKTITTALQNGIESRLNLNLKTEPSLVNNVPLKNAGSIISKSASKVNDNTVLTKDDLVVIGKSFKDFFNLLTGQTDQNRARIALDAIGKDLEPGKDAFLQFFKEFRQIGSRTGDISHDTEQPTEKINVKPKNPLVRDTAFDDAAFRDLRLDASHNATVAEEDARRRFQAGSVSGIELAQAGSQSRELKIQTGDYGTKDAFRSFLDEFKANFQDFQHDLNSILKDTADNIKSGLGSALAEYATGKKNAGNAFRDFGINLLDQFTQNLTKNSVNIVFGLLSKAGNSIASNYFSGGGLVKGYASGGSVRGGSGMKDDVPAFLTGGEFVINKAIAQSIGQKKLDAVNQGISGPNYTGLSATQFPVQGTGGSQDPEISKYFSGALKPDPGANAKTTISDVGPNRVSINLKNAYAFSDAQHPTGGYFNVDPNLSVAALEDTNNPQNQVRNQRQSDLTAYLKETAAYKLKLKQFENAKNQRVYSAYVNAAIQVGGAYLGAETGGAAKTATTAAQGNNYYDATGSPNFGTPRYDATGSPNFGANYYTPSSNYGYNGFNIRRMTGGIIPAYATGGEVFGADEPTDSINAKLTGGEYVIRREMVKKYGSNYLDEINHGTAKRFATGGLVSSTDTNDDLAKSIERLITSTNSVTEALTRTPIKAESPAQKDSTKSSGGLINNFTITINIDKDGKANTNTSANSNGKGVDDASARKFAEVIKAQIISTIAEQKKPGGLLA